MTADQMHGERLLSSQYVQQGDAPGQAMHKTAQLPMGMNAISIKDMAAVIVPSMSQSLDIGEHNYCLWNASTDHFVVLRLPHRHAATVELHAEALLQLAAHELVRCLSLSSQDVCY